ncbi:MAG: hypothetical protein DBP02_15035 [gamma proteobacterium symbiont of Ctena orbiculata]|nr:MAG: hypothetical protein DBP02_15035 [gamma proteobacterium symbiont of Ctena orbiculata]
MTMTINTTLKDFNESEFRAWFDATARTGIDYDTTLRAALDSMERDHEIGADPSYELSKAYTKSGQPETYWL